MVAVFTNGTAYRRPPPRIVRARVTLTNLYYLPRNSPPLDAEGRRTDGDAFAAHLYPNASVHAYFLRPAPDAAPEERVCGVGLHASEMLAGSRAMRIARDSEFVRNWTSSPFCPLPHAQQVPFQRVVVVTLVTPNLDKHARWNLATLRQYCARHRHQLWVARRNFTSSEGMHTNWPKVEAIRRVLALGRQLADFALYADADSLPVMASCSLAQIVAANRPYYLPTLATRGDDVRDVVEGTHDESATCSGAAQVWFPVGDFDHSSGYATGWPRSQSLGPNQCGLCRVPHV